MDCRNSEQTLVLAVSTLCHCCTERAGFYQGLAQQKAKQGGLRLVAVLPQAVRQGKAYLTKLGVSVDEVRQSPMDALGVRGTPTLLLVDKSGTLKALWVGKLSPEKEGEVLSRLWENKRADKMLQARQSGHVPETPSDN